MNRTRIAELRAEAVRMASENGDEPPEIPDVEEDSFGTPEEQITTEIDVSSVIGLKREAMAAHSSQIDGDSFFLAMPEEAFGLAFGTEWYIRVDPEAGVISSGRRETSLL